MNQPKADVKTKSYKLILKNLPICTVDVLFFDPNKKQTLLFKRTNDPAKGLYYSIGGRLLKNEDLIECALRQAKKEAGIKLSKKQLVFGGVQNEIWTNSAFKNISYHAVDIFYGVIINKRVKIKLDDQHNDYRWFLVKDKNIHPLVKNKINSLIKKI